ncbi:unnamed protein product [Schistocephalus solidus]|uniref:Peptidase_S9 domain-containing protein n=1 Tax=Schistocephalus solidus TaxID=70667 RepID=A0A183SLV5_SCHSO|nr:unnamed protein product [Schistocephalus solidus]
MFDYSTTITAIAFAEINTLRDPGTVVLNYSTRNGILVVDAGMCELFWTQVPKVRRHAVFIRTMWMSVACLNSESSTEVQEKKRSRESTPTSPCTTAAHDTRLVDTVWPLPSRNKPTVNYLHGNQSTTEWVTYD